MQQQYSRYRELPVVADLVGESVILGMSEAFVKMLDVVTIK